MDTMFDDLDDGEGEAEDDEEEEAEGEEDEEEDEDEEDEFGQALENAMDEDPPAPAKMPISLNAYAGGEYCYRISDHPAYSNQTNWPFLSPRR